MRETHPRRSRSISSRHQLCNSAHPLQAPQARARAPRSSLQWHAYQTPGGTYAFWSWRVISAEPGNYVITASATSPEADPDLSNNSRTFAFQVAPPISGGGGGEWWWRWRQLGDGESGEALPSAAESRHVRHGHGTADERRLRCATEPCDMCSESRDNDPQGQGQGGEGSASCTFKPPASAKGEGLHGTVTVSALGKTIRRTFSVGLR